MENRTVRDRLSALRAFMTERKIDVYLIPTEDFHSSEYVSDYFKVREYFCGFTGSNAFGLAGRGGTVDGRKVFYPGAEGARRYGSNAVSDAGRGRSYH